MDETILIPTYLLIIGSIFSALIGAVVSSGIIILTGLVQRTRQRKALLVVFTTDLVGRFMRATMYYNQNRKGAISYSTLYEATDPNTLVKLAEVIKDQDVINTIVELNGDYYQIQRHVLEASKFAVEQSLQEIICEDLIKSRGAKHPKAVEAKEYLQEVKSRAFGAQSRAIAFFDFEKTLKGTKELLKYTKKHAGGSYIDSLEEKFKQRLEEKKEADKQV